MAEPLEILDLPRESWTLVEAVHAQARRLGDRPFLSFADGEALGFGALDRCASRMPRFAVPRYVEFAAALEKTATGKVRKQALCQAGVTGATRDREAAGYTVPAD
jgi:acyl-CoA synthetase (AMP-forming)/AMP-acid ligase II